MARRALELAAVGLTLVSVSACGGSSQAELLGQAAQNLSKVRSGNMDLRMAVSAGDGSGQVGFEEKRPFALPSPGALPVAQTEVSHFVGSKQEGTTFISTGRRAYIASAGQAYELPAATVTRLRQASAGSGNLSGLQLDRWAAATTMTDGGQVDGVSTDRFAGSVNVPQFLNDVMQLSRGLSQTAVVPLVTTSEAADLARAVRASHFQLWAGRDDHLVRRVSVSVDFSAPSGAAASQAMARYSQSQMRLDLDLSSVNRPVTVSDPPGAQPFAVYCGRQPDASSCATAPS